MIILNKNNWKIMNKKTNLNELKIIIRKIIKESAEEQNKRTVFAKYLKENFYNNAIGLLKDVPSAEKLKYIIHGIAIPNEQIDFIEPSNSSYDINAIIDGYLNLKHKLKEIISKYKLADNYEKLIDNLKVHKENYNSFQNIVNSLLKEKVFNQKLTNNYIATRTRVLKFYVNPIINENKLIEMHLVFLYFVLNNNKYGTGTEPIIRQGRNSYEKCKFVLSKIYLSFIKFEKKLIDDFKAGFNEVTSDNIINDIYTQQESERLTSLKTVSSELKSSSYFDAALKTNEDNINILRINLDELKEKLTLLQAEYREIDFLRKSINKHKKPEDFNNVKNRLKEKSLEVLRISDKINEINKTISEFEKDANDLISNKEEILKHVEGEKDSINTARAIRVQKEIEEKERLAIQRLNTLSLDDLRSELDKLNSEKNQSQRQEAERLIVQKEREQRQEAERIERERLAREEQNRLEAERIERERLAREEQNRLEAERIERERLTREEQERLSREKQRQEAERLIAQKEREQRQEAERIERERLAREEQEKERIKELQRQELDNLRDEINTLKNNKNIGDVDSLLPENIRALKKTLLDDIKHREETIITPLRIEAEKVEKIRDKKLKRMKIDKISDLSEVSMKIIDKISEIRAEINKEEVNLSQYKTEDQILKRKLQSAKSGFFGFGGEKGEIAKKNKENEELIKNSKGAIKYLNKELINYEKKLIPIQRIESLNKSLTDFLGLISSERFFNSLLAEEASSLNINSNITKDEIMFRINKKIEDHKQIIDLPTEKMLDVLSGRLTLAQAKRALSSEQEEAERLEQQIRDESEREVSSLAPDLDQQITTEMKMISKKLKKTQKTLNEIKEVRKIIKLYKNLILD
jgi:hypothetical protein